MPNTMLYTFIIQGVVQGVGFRPYIFNACKKAGIVGYVQNVGNGVKIVTSKKNALEDILKNIPKTAEIYSCSTTKKQVQALPKDFSLRKSTGKGFAEIPPDFFTCEKCLGEMRDSRNRRHQYFFTTCTHCGPRFTMAKKSPYDRETTSMRAFPMCAKCQKEYVDPKNRRYHAQTIACHACGPVLSFFQRSAPKKKYFSNDAIQSTIEKLRDGEVVSIKGIGGFHLACLINKKSVQSLKKLTGRTDKPFAVLCQDIKMARELATITKKEQVILLSKERPIVICKKKSSLGEITELDTVGIMLPYTALHTLLLDALRMPLVCTSSNLSGEPITTEESEQFAPFVLTHSRDIIHSTDDSLIKVIQEKPLLIRRSRGFVPRSIEAPHAPKKTILALGAEMNASFCLLKDGRATASQYLGNTARPHVLDRYKKELRSFLAFMRAKPDHILCDLHPDYATTRLAEELSEKWRVPLTKIQHHRAHAASIAFEHGLQKSVDIVCDGLGYGEDGTIWGGEIFVDDTRVGHLEYQPQLGGDLATKDPDRMLFGILSKFLSQKEIQKIIGKRHKTQELNVWREQLKSHFNTPETSSCGRVLDAASALLGFPSLRTYDGRAAMNLESNAMRPYPLKPVMQTLPVVIASPRSNLGFGVRTGLLRGLAMTNEKYILLTTPLFEFLVKNLHRDRTRLAATVLHYLAEGLYQIAHEYNFPITFSGGCAYNTHMTQHLLSKGVLINKNIPPGDGGISFGQIAWFI